MAQHGMQGPLAPRELSPLGRLGATAELALHEGLTQPALGLVNLVSPGGPSMQALLGEAGTRVDRRVEQLQADLDQGVQGMPSPGEFIASGPGPAVQKASKAAKRGRKLLRLWHGSPHLFKVFSNHHIGRGEGHQAFSRGLYFAELKKVAQEYAEGIAFFDADRLMEWALEHPDAAKRFEQWANLSNRRRPIWAGVGKEGYTPLDMEELAGIAQVIQHGKYPNHFKEDTIELLDEIIQGIPHDVKRSIQATYKGNTPHLYEVDVDIMDDEWLDWDAMFMDMDPGVQEKLIDLIAKHPAADEVLGNPQELAGMTGEGIYRSLQDNIEMRLRWDPDSFDTDALEAAEAATSAMLDKAGIHGMRYLDMGSRSSGEGTRNFVVFNDKRIKTVSRDGVPYASLAAALATLFGLQAQSSGPPLLRRGERSE